MAARPEQAIAEIPPALRARMAALTSDIDIDLDAPIEGKVEI